MCEVVRETQRVSPERTEVRETQRVSPEQRAAINAVLAGHNVIINSCAGSGKTFTAVTLIHAFCAKYREAVPIFMTYNRRLCDETREKYASIRARFDARRVINTFHSLCGAISRNDPNFANQICHDDIIFMKMIDACAPYHYIAQYLAQQNMGIQRGRYLIIVDESQDMTPSIFKLVAQIWQGIAKLVGARKTSRMQLVVIGDVRQCIYKYRDADSRFLTHIGKILRAPMQLHNLTVTYRCGSSIVRMINRCFEFDSPQYLPIRAAQGMLRENLPIKYIITYPRNKLFAQYIVRLIREYGAGRTLILVPSIEGLSYANSWETLETAISRASLPIKKSRSDQEDIVLPNADAVTIATYHQSKGCGADLTIVLGMDLAYSQYISHTYRFTNAQYVALTRAQKQLVIVQRNSCRPIRQIDHICNCGTYFADYINTMVFDSQMCARLNRPSYNLPSLRAITRAVSTAPIDALLLADDFARDKTIIRAQNCAIDIDRVIQLEHQVAALGDLREEVSDINGIAVTLYFDMLRRSQGDRGIIYRTLMARIDDLRARFAEMWAQTREKVRTSVSRDAIRLMRQTLVSVEVRTRLLRENMDSRTMFDAHLLSIISQIATLCGIMQARANFYRLNQIQDWEWFARDGVKVREIIARMNNVLAANNVGENAGEIAEKPCSFTCDNGARTYLGAIDFASLGDEDSRAIYEIKCTRELTRTHLLQLLVYAYATCRELNHDADFDAILYNPLIDIGWRINARDLTLARLQPLIDAIIRGDIDEELDAPDEAFITFARAIVDQYN